MPRVFFISRPDYDTSTSEVYGESIYLLPTLNSGHERPNALDIPSFCEYVARLLEHHAYNDAEDYIAVSGRTLEVMLFGQVVSAIYTNTRYLIFSERDKEYKERSQNWDVLAEKML